MTDSAFPHPDLIAHLRQELLRQQDRRAAYVRLKFTFIVGLFSLVAALQAFRQTEDLLWSNAILYGIPIVAAMFDLYILGGEYAVKRIRAFLRLHDVDGNGERMWSEFLGTLPKSFVRKNRPRATNFVSLLVATVALADAIRLEASALTWAIYAVWLVGVFVLNTYLYRVEARVWAVTGTSAKAYTEGLAEPGVVEPAD